MGEESRAEMLDRKRKNLCDICGEPEIDGMYDETHRFINGQWVTTFWNPLDIGRVNHIMNTQGHPFKQKVK
jgi:hypothetical protein